MAKQLIDQFAAALPADKRASVYQSTKSTHEKRTKMLFDQFAEPNRLRSLAGEIKQHVLEHLDTLLPEVEEDPTFHKLSDYWAADPVTRMQILGTFESTDNLATRTVSYDPPEGSIPIAG